jgi:hypothetical protein
MVRLALGAYGDLGRPRRTRMPMRVFDLPPGQEVVTVLA